MDFSSVQRKGNSFQRSDGVERFRDRAELKERSAHDLLTAFAQDVFFVRLHFTHESSAGRHVGFEAVVIIDCAEREYLALLQKRHAARVVPIDFEGAEFGSRFDERDEQRFDHAAGADDPGGDAVDAGVEIIESDMDSVQITAAHDLLRDGE